MSKKEWRICKTEVRPLRGRLIQPFRTALGDHHTLDNLLFAIYLEGGKAYFGEAAVATHITGETQAETHNNLHAAGRWLAGRDIREYLRISAGLHERFGQNPAAIAAVEMALADALTSRLHIPLWKLFGTKCRRLKTDITIVLADLQETAVTARRFYRQGFRQFKIKVGRDLDLDIKRIEAVHQWAPKAVIYVDANQGFSAGETIEFLRAVKRLGIHPALLEQPVPRDDWDGLKKISRSTSIPVCADESVRTLAEAVKMIKEQAAAVINIKLMKFGLIHADAIARLARASGVQLMIGGMLESTLAMTASAHLAAGLGCFSYIDLDTPFFIRGEVTRNPYLAANGTYDLRRVRHGVGVKPLLKR